MTPPIPAEDTRDKFIGIRITPDDYAAVTARAAALGLSGPVWARNTLLDALEDETGYQDSARRSNRRPNQKPRKDRQGDPPWLMLRVSAAEHKHIKAHAESLGTTITGWAWSVITAALEKEGQQQ